LWFANLLPLVQQSKDQQEQQPSFSLVGMLFLELDHLPIERGLAWDAMDLL
jgi:hypothetical protein